MKKKQDKYQKTSELPLVAVDMGSRSVRAMAVQRVGEDLFRILGVEECGERPKAIANGVIRQSYDAAYALNRALTLLANRIGVTEIPTAFVCLGGKSMGVVEVKSHRDQVRKRVITAQLLEEMQTECKQKIEAHHPGVAVLSVIPSFFLLDGERVEDAEGRYATVVEGHYSAFYGRKVLETNVKDSFLQAKRNFEHAFVRPDVLLSVFATEDGRDLLDNGCAILDMGHQTTTLTIYKGNEYICNKVVAQGSGDITRFLEQQGVTAKMAETLKTRYGYASAGQVEKNLTLKIPAAPEIGGTFHLTSEELADTIEEKLSEILSPLLQELNTYAERINTLYITGGGSMLCGVDDYIQKRTPVRVRYGNHSRLLTADTPEQYFAPNYTSLVGTVLLGQDYRDTHGDKMVQQHGFIDKITTMMVDIFSANEELQPE